MLNGIKEIVDFEYKQLRDSLLRGILSDFIRKEFYINSHENDIGLNKIGVIPIFEKLRRENVDDKKIGVLTGSMMIIPKSAYPIFEAKAATYGISQVSSSYGTGDDNYILIYQNEQIKNDVIYLITQIFQCGGIEILIGIKSLLGEGWDAPSTNSLILASFVGSFVLSNQMRGRAMRVPNGNADETANISHLVTTDQTSLSGGNDFELFKKEVQKFRGYFIQRRIRNRKRDWAFGLTRKHLPMRRSREKK